MPILAKQIGINMLYIITHTEIAYTGCSCSDTEVEKVFSTVLQGPANQDMDALYREYLQYHNGDGDQKKLMKDKNNLTKKGKLKQSALNKLRYERTSYPTWLIENKRFKKVEYKLINYHNKDIL